MTRGADDKTEGSMRTSTGRSLGGAPLAFNKLPAADLMPWFTWLAVTDAELPAGRAISCCMLNDHAAIRILFGGVWTAETADGLEVFDPGADGLALYFGPQTRAMPLTVDGSFKVLTLHLGPGAATVLGAPEQKEMLDRITSCDELLGIGSKLSAHFEMSDTPVAVLEQFEKQLRDFVEARNVARPDPLAIAFEDAAMADPNLTVGEFAQAQDISPRTLARIVRREYGLTPKQVLRRARALDLAALLTGVALEEEEMELRLRYFDQSHLIREMRHFFDMTPGQLSERPHPLMTLNLEIRQSRRIELLSRLAPGTIRPWRDPLAEPRG